MTRPNIRKMVSDTHISMEVAKYFGIIDKKNTFEIMPPDFCNDLRQCLNLVGWYNSGLVVHIDASPGDLIEKYRVRFSFKGKPLKESICHSSPCIAILELLMDYDQCT